MECLKILLKSVFIMRLIPMINNYLYKIRSRIEQGAKTTCKSHTVVIMTRFSVFNAKNYRFAHKGRFISIVGSGSGTNKPFVLIRPAVSIQDHHHSGKSAIHFIRNTISERQLRRQQLIVNFHSHLRHWKRTFGSEKHKEKQWEK